MSETTYQDLVNACRGFYGFEQLPPCTNPLPPRLEDALAAPGKAAHFCPDHSLFQTLPSVRADSLLLVILRNVFLLFPLTLASLSLSTTYFPDASKR